MDNLNTEVEYFGTTISRPSILSDYLFHNLSVIVYTPIGAIEFQNGHGYYCNDFNAPSFDQVPYLEFCPKWLYQIYSISDGFGELDSVTLEELKEEFEGELEEKINTQEKLKKAIELYEHAEKLAQKKADSFIRDLEIDDLNLDQNVPCYDTEEEWSEYVEEAKKLLA